MTAHSAVIPEVGVSSAIVLSEGAQTINGLKTFTGLNVPKTSGTGLSVDGAFGWADIIGNVQPKATGAGSPARAAYGGANLAQYAFVANDVCEFEYHIPHHHAPGTDLFWHVHWSHNATTITGRSKRSGTNC